MRLYAGMETPNIGLLPGFASRANKLSIQMLRDLETLSSLEVDRTKSLGFGAKQRVYRIVDSSFRISLMTSKGDAGVEYETGQAEFSKMKYLDRRRISHEYVECDFEYVLRNSREEVQIELLNLFI
jgi:hypothetical protein